MRYTSSRRTILALVIGGLSTIVLPSAPALADQLFTVNPGAVSAPLFFYTAAPFTAGLIDFSYKAQVDSTPTMTGGSFHETGVASFSTFRKLDQTVVPAGTSGLNLFPTIGYQLWATFVASGTTTFSVDPIVGGFEGHIHFTVTNFEVSIFADPDQDDCIQSSAHLTCPGPPGLTPPIAIGTAGGNEDVVLVDPGVIKDDKLVAHHTAFIVGDGNAFFQLPGNPAPTDNGSFQAVVSALPDVATPGPGTGGLFFVWPPAGFSLPARARLSGNNDNIQLPSSNPGFTVFNFTDAFITGAGQVHVDFPLETPEPTTLLLLGSGLSGLVIWQWSRSKKA